MQDFAFTYQKISEEQDPLVLDQEVYINQH